MPVYENVNAKMVQATLTAGETIYARKGSMLAYTGDVAFNPTLAAGASVGGFVGRMVAGEQVPLMVTEGAGAVMYGHGGLHATITHLNGEQLSIEADKLLCYDGMLQAGTMFLGAQGGLRGIVQGQVSGQGLFTTQIVGYGSVVMLSHGPVFEVAVDSTTDVAVDPQAYVGHKGLIDVKLEASVGWREAVGRSSGEAFQLKLSGQGTVYIQPSEQSF
jgi:uncharacterized protein (AIM24 family)